MNIEGTFFFQNSTRSYQANLTFKDGAFTVYGDEFASIEDLKIRSIQEPTNLYFTSGHYFSSNKKLPPEIFKLTQSKTKQSIYWLERISLPKILICMLLLAAFIFLIRAAFNSASDWLVVVFPKAIEQELGQRIYEEIGSFLFSDSSIPEIVQENFRKEAADIAVINEFSYNSKIYFHSSFIGPNAIAFPGGPIVITDELIRLMDDKNEILAVIAHEMAHIEQRHSIQQLIKYIGISSLLSMYLNSNAGGVEELSSEVIANLNLLRHSRVFEKEADLLAIEYLQNYGVPPVHLLDAIRKLFNYYCGTEQIDPTADCMGDKWSWLATHPSGNDRLNYINEYIR